LAFPGSIERRCRNRHEFPRRISSGIAEFDAEQAGDPDLRSYKGLILVRKFQAVPRRERRRLGCGTFSIIVLAHFFIAMSFDHFGFLLVELRRL